MCGQPPQHQADPRVVRPAGSESHVLARRRRTGRPVRGVGPRRRVGAADDEVDALLDEGWEPRNIALLTTGHRHPIQVERTAFHDQEGYWGTYWDDDVFYGHVLGCKGLERRAVVLCLNEDGSRDRAGSGCTSGCRGPRTCSSWSVIPAPFGGWVGTMSRGGWGSRPTRPPSHLRSGLARATAIRVHRLVCRRRSPIGRAAPRALRRCGPRPEIGDLLGDAPCSFRGAPYEVINRVLPG